LRHERIVALLNEGAAGELSHAMGSMAAIQADTQSLYAEALLPALLALAPDAEAVSAPAQDVLEALAVWEGSCPSGLSGTDPEGAADPSSEVRDEARGCLVFHAWVLALLEGAFFDELTLAEIDPGDVMGSLARALWFLLVQPESLASGQSLWDDLGTDPIEGSDLVIADALEATGARLVDELGDDPEEWLWGRAHTLTLIAEPFHSNDVPSFDNGPYANDGALWTVDVANPQGGDDWLAHQAGPALRIISEVSSSAGWAAAVPRLTALRRFAGGLSGQ
jgi:penicillin amidase